MHCVIYLKEAQNSKPGLSLISSLIENDWLAPVMAGGFTTEDLPQEPELCKESGILLCLLWCGLRRLLMFKSQPLDLL